MAVQLNILLAGCAGGFAKRFPLRYEDLRPNDVDAGDFLCHRVFHLDPRVDLNEIEFLTVHIH